ncbi:hypothetical protein ACTHGU_17620 [Chitinophagaceae bacterium MMS25-I14]
MPNNMIDSLKEIRVELGQESCTPKEPFIKLGKGQAPVLNYNIPQTSVFSTYGNFKVKGVDPRVFQEQCRLAPAGNFFEHVESMPVEQLQQKFSEAVQLQTPHAKLIPNSLLLRKHISLAQSNLTAVALALPMQAVADKTFASPPDSPRIVESTNALNEVQLARLAKEGQMPYVVQKLGGFQTRVHFLPKPKAAEPYFVVIEEYKTAAYLGDYGAGRVVKTFSLLPGEKTTISVRTYKDLTSTKSFSENVLDSFSESSTSELEHNIETENSVGASSTNSNSSTDTSGHNWNVSASASVSLFGCLNLGGGGGGGGTSSSSSTSAYSGTRTANVKAVNRAIDKHVAQSNSNRQINVNTSTTDTAKEGEEDTTVRELVNFNKSRTLTHVWRQMLQEYLTITYLSNIRIAYCNGYAESLRVVDIEQLDELLADTIVPGEIDNVRKQILKPYCTITNYQDDEIDFIEQQTINYGACLGIKESESFFRIKKGLEDTYTDGGLEIKVKGVILHVAPQTLRTSSLVVDALLGQGEALDCYNQKAQDAESMKGYIQNMELLQQIKMIDDISDPDKKVEMYKKVFGTCCDTPQTEVIH